MTLKTRDIPCLDVKDGRVVKGVNFVDLINAGDPVESAAAYDAAGGKVIRFKGRMLEAPVIRKYRAVLERKGSKSNA